MVSRRHTGGSSGPNIFLSLFKSIISIIVLTAFVLGITFLVRGIGQLEIKDVVKAANPLLARLHLNVNEDEVGQVAGSMISRLTNTNIAGGGSSVRVSEDSAGLTPTPMPSTTSGVTSTTNVRIPSFSNTSGQVKYSLGLVSDVHSDFAGLQKTLSLLKQSQVSTLFFLGDLTAFGVVSDLKQGKDILDNSGIEYFVLPGDRDLYNSVGLDNFLEVFKKTNDSKTIDGTKFIIFDNSANYTPITEEKMAWFANEVKNADFVILSQPLYAGLKIDRYMGHIDGKDTQAVLSQRDALLQEIRDSNVKAVVSGDLHLAGEAADPVKSTLKHIYIGHVNNGALTNELDLQTPRFSKLIMYENGGYAVENVVLE
jgi:Icc-related predicted phosphoesterase